MIYHGGFNIYGEIIGILVLETSFPRIPGDIGNATSFNFPVRYKIVKGATPKRITHEFDKKILKNFIEAAKELENDGVKAITTTCGYLAIFQKQLSEAVDIPVFTSSLLQIPIIYRMLRPNEKIGILVANAKTFHKDILKEVGAENVPSVITGLYGNTEFDRIREDNIIDVEKAEEEVVLLAKNLVKEDPLIKAIVIEGANLPPYSKKINEATGLPVFDIMTLIKWVYSALIQNEYHGYM